MLETILKPIVDYFMAMGLAGMALVAYLEAIFLPLPPDVMLFACALCKPHSALWYALVSGVASALGAATNYWIGLKGGRKLFHMIFKNQHHQLDKIEKMYQKHGVLTVFIIAFTPIPFMIFTMASGIFELTFWPFFFACLAGRTMRFLAFSSLVVAFGSAIKDNIDIFFAILAVAIVAVYFLFHRPKKEEI